jgi:alcohol dehydrogenase (NADP+)
MESVTFKNGDQMPTFGLGTWKSAPHEAYEAVLEAIRIGYRHIDCAHIYKNEEEIGAALAKAFKEGWVKREEMWITSKLWNDCHERVEVLPALTLTLKNLQLDYLDLYLVHWPVALKKGIDFPSHKEDFLSYEQAPLESTWKAMEENVDSGLVRHIGVSNFNRNKIKEIKRLAKIQPEMNQVEMHPFLPQTQLLKFCKDNGIFVTAYAPLGSAYRVNNGEVDYPILLEEEHIKKIAEKHNATPAQVAIRWGMQRGTVVIPKTVKKHRLLENFGATKLVLDQEDMDQINSLEGPFRYTTGMAWTMEGSPFVQEDLWDAD